MLSIALSFLNQHLKETFLLQTMEEELELVQSIFCGTQEHCNVTQLHHPITRVDVQLKVDENILCKIKAGAKCHIVQNPNFSSFQ